MAEEPLDISKITHESYDGMRESWDKWRLSYKAGDDFIDIYLAEYSTRETVADYELRKSLTYCPAFASSSIEEIRNSIFERMIDISRKGGSKIYQDAIKGDGQGVDRKGSSMNRFMGIDVLTELLPMKTVGIYVDRPAIDQGSSVQGINGKDPYLYLYRVEDILAWTFDDNENLMNLLLQDHVPVFDEIYGLEIGTAIEYRLLTLVPIEEGGAAQVVVEVFNNDGEPLPTRTRFLGINKIPFIFVQLSDSLMNNAANYQIAHLNLASSDMFYLFTSNFPFYVEEAPKHEGNHLKTGLPDDGTAETADVAQDRTISRGTTKGRQYVHGTQAPGFIHPSSEPINASMDKQDALKQEVRQIIHLAVTNLQPRVASAESKEMDDRGLEAGLSYIGLELEHAEREVVIIWELYLDNKSVATINYPDDYSLKSDQERLAEAEKLEELKSKLPSKTFQRVTSKQIAKLISERFATSEEVEAINRELDSAEVLVNDPAIIKEDHEAGFVSTETASEARGYPKGEVDQANCDHEERLSRIAIAQSKASNENLNAARGIPDGDENPSQNAKQEKTDSQNEDTK